MRKGFIHFQSLWLALLDAACLAASVLVGVVVRRALGSTLGPLDVSLADYIQGHWDGWIYFCGSIMVSNYIAGTYTPQGTVYRFNLFVNWVFALMVAVFVISVTSFTWFQLLLGRGVLAFAIASYAVFSLVSKGVTYGWLLRREPFVCRVVLLGTGPRSGEVRQMLESRFVLPRHEVCAFVSVKPGDPPSGDANGVPVLSAGADRLEDTARSLDPHLIIMCFEARDESLPYHAALRRLRFSGIEVMDALSAAEAYGGRVPLDLVDDVWLMEASLHPSISVVSRIKRILDVAAVGASLPVMAPLAAGLALVIKLFDRKGPVLYTQTRVGQFGRPFRILKFRTMVVDAERHTGAVWAAPDDARITPVGRFLRKCRLDEVPQLWNVMRGDMSLVGPRPERPEIVQKLEEMIPHYRERENALPGLTGWAQVQYPYVDKVEDVSRKLEFDLFYIKNLSVRLDVQIILRTLRIVFFGRERAA